MDDELQQLEAELKRLRPAALSPELTRRVATELEQRPVRRTVAPVHVFWATALAAAAAVAIA